MLSKSPNHDSQQEINDSSIQLNNSTCMVSEKITSSCNMHNGYHKYKWYDCGIMIRVSACHVFHTCIILHGTKKISKTTETLRYIVSQEKIQFSAL